MKMKAVIMAADMKSTSNTIITISMLSTLDVDTSPSDDVDVISDSVNTVHTVSVSVLNK